MTAILHQLRERIASLEGFSPPRMTRICPTGWSEIDRALPGGGLLQGALHEIHAPDPADGAGIGFAAHLVGRFQVRMPARMALWASCRMDLFAPGLVAAGIDPSQVVMINCRTQDELLFAFEESCKCSLLSAIAGDIGEIDFSLSRRLQLACAETGTTLVLLRPSRFEEAPSAAVTRWHVEATSDGAWALSLFRCRGGRTGQWQAWPRRGRLSK